MAETDSTKKVVYLIGAGATQAEIMHLGAYPVNCLMRDHKVLGEGVSTGILNRLGGRWLSFLGESIGTDVEKLISLMSAAGVEELSRAAERMRRYYFEEIRTRLMKAGVVANPQLAIALLQMHADQVFAAKAETLSGVITTNHDGLFQIAFEEVYSGVNLGFTFSSRHFRCVAEEPLISSVPPLLQLHGSFSWKFGLPISVSKLHGTSRYSKNTTWIPPTILKESKMYPFNKLNGIAYELLAKKCDVLRVIGASLTQNDWNILCLIFNAQQHNELRSGSPFKIELIMPPDRGEDLAQECTYLKHLTPIQYLTEGHFAEYNDPAAMNTPELRNPFAFWLKEKYAYHHSRTELTKATPGTAIAAVVGETA
jgi:hypothetical protein